MVTELVMVLVDMAAMDMVVMETVVMDMAVMDTVILAIVQIYSQATLHMDTTKISSVVSKWYNPNMR